MHLALAVPHADSGEGRHDDAADAAPATRSHNVPEALSSFVGRARELAMLVEAAQGHRLLTLVGPGGAGKTRLARELAARVVTQGSYDAVWWVELAPLRDATEVVPTLAGALGVSTQPGRSLLDAVTVALRLRRTLLVLDNCEHVIDEVAQVVHHLLREAAITTVITTSREPLAVDGEVAWQVPALALPSQGRHTALSLATSEAVQLFVERARASAPFTLTDANAPVVAAICTRLDGLPLAIELAAAVVPMFGTEGLAARLDDALALLARGKRSAAPRHRTLRAVLDWSYDLLGEDERTLLRRLSVFRGSFTLEAIAEVCLDEHAAGMAWLVAVLGRLVEQSLVDVREERGEARYRLLETVRQYGDAKLRETADDGRVRDRHAQWITRQAIAAEDSMFSPQRGRTVARLAGAMEEIRAALEWSLSSQGNVQHAIQLTGSLGWYWISGVPWGEARVLVHRVLDAADAEGIPDSARPLAERLWLGRMFYPVMGLAYFAGDTATMLAAAKRDAALWATVDTTSLSTADRLAADRQRVLGQQLHGIALGMLGQVREAIGYMNQSVEGAVASADAWLHAVMLIRRALVHFLTGSTEAAHGDYACAIPLLEQQGETWFLSLALEGMANVLVAKGEMGRALVHVRNAALVLHGERDPWFVSRACDTTAWVIANGRDGTPLAAPAAARVAVRLMGAADALRRSCGAGVIGPDVPRQVELERLLVQRVGATEHAALWANGTTWTLDDVFDVLSDDATLRRAIEEDDRHAEGMPVPVPEIEEPAPVAPVTLTVLGRFSMRLHGHAVPESQLPTGKQRELLLYLLVHDGGTKEEIGLALWPDSSAAQVRNLFHVTLHHLRRALGDDPWIVFERSRYRLCRHLDGRGALRSDVDDLVQVAAAVQRAVRGTRGTSTAAGVDTSMLDRWREQLAECAGDLLASAGGAEWLVAEQDRLRLVWSEALERLVLLAQQQAAHDHVVRCCDLLLAREPLREAAHRAYMDALAARGEPSRALAHYEQLVALLQREVGARPASETQAVAARIRATPG